MVNKVIKQLTKDVIFNTKLRRIEN